MAKFFHDVCFSIKALSILIIVFEMTVLVIPTTLPYLSLVLMLALSLQTVEGFAH